MTTEVESLSDALDAWQTTLHAPRVLRLTPGQRQALLQTAARVRAEFLGGPDPSLLIALAGGTGAGKSTLINALAGAPIAESSEMRPTTLKLRVYHHRDLAQGNLPFELGHDTRFVAHDRPELRHKVLVDTPDLDSFVSENRATARALLKAAGLVLYVFSSENYANERVWSVIRDERQFSSCAVVLNRVDQLGTLEDVTRVTDDIREKFAALGLADVRVFRTVAKNHIPGVTATNAPHNIDETDQLRQFIEQELQASDIMRMIRQKRQAVVAHLRDELDRITPRDLAAQLAAVSQVADSVAGEVATAWLHELRHGLERIEGELGIAATLQLHERFRGPLRTWLALTDFLRFGVPGLLDRLRGQPPRGDAQALEHILGRTQGTDLEHQLQRAAAKIGDALHARDLPFEAWRRLTEQAAADRWLRRVALAVQQEFDEELAAQTRKGGWRVWFFNVVGMLAPAAVVVGGLYVMGWQLYQAQYVGLELFLHLAAMLVLFYIGLQGVISIVLPGGGGLGRASLEKALREVLSRGLQDWVSDYRRLLEDDLRQLRRPLELLEANPSQGLVPLQKNEVVSAPSASVAGSSV